MKHLTTIGLLALCTGAAQAQVYLEVAGASGISGAFNAVGTYPTGLRQMSGGASVGDFNMDGLPDIYAPSGGTAPDRLYINQGGGQFADEAAAWGVGVRIRAMGSAVGDFNRDGYPDLYVVSCGDIPGDPSTDQSRLYRNNGPDEHGQFTFTDVAVEAGVNTVADLVGGMGAAWGDFDLDGDLDLFVSAWRVNSGGNRLFRNDGPDEGGVYRFADISDLITFDGPIRGFTPRFADMNDDRLPDLLLTNDYATSRLLINNGPDADEPFTVLRNEAGITADCNGMGASVADVNGDHLLDWYITNIYFSPSDTCGNNMYINNGPGVDGIPTFSEEAEGLGVRRGGWGWGCSIADFNNDGLLDVVATNGWTGTEQPPRLWINEGNGQYTNIAPGCGLSFTGQGRGLFHIDYDDDGDLDIAFVENGGALRLYQTDLGEADHNYLRVRLTTRTHQCVAPMGYGTRLILDVGESSRFEYVDGENTYLGQSEMVLHFGLGAATQADRLHIEWADGSTTELFDIAANQTIDVVAYHPADWDRSSVLDVYDLLGFLGAFSENNPDADVDGSGTLDLFDALLMLDLLSEPCP